MYTPLVSRTGVKCVVRVNHREYHTDRPYSSEVLATENAAMRAYLICRNFSVNDGRVPSSNSVGAGSVMQGLPVAIGTGRRGTVGSGRSTGSEGSDMGSEGTMSGGSSPGSAEFPISYRGGAGRRGSERSDGRGMVIGGSRRR